MPNMLEPLEGSSAWKAQDKGPAILRVCWTFIAASTLFVIARVYVRTRILRMFHSDDYYVILGLVSNGTFSHCYDRGGL